MISQKAENYFHCARLVWGREDRSASKLLQRTGTEHVLADRSLVSFSDYSYLGTRPRACVYRPRVMSHIQHAEGAFKNLHHSKISRYTVVHSMLSATEATGTLP